MLEPSIYDNKKRCFGNKPNQQHYAQYHDNEWGKPVHDDKELFEMLILEGAHAGLSWLTILNKRQGYKKAFHNFDINKCANLSDTYLEQQLQNTEIVRNKLKVYSIRKNALVFKEIQNEFGSFDKYLWNYVNHKPIKNSLKNFEQVPTSTPISNALSKDLKKRGMSFVGPTIIYAYMQAIGMVIDHLKDCWLYKN